LLLEHIKYCRLGIHYNKETVGQAEEDLTAVIVVHEIHLNMQKHV
jgi:hypothetical protein